MDSCKVSEFDKGQIVMAREMGVSVSETASLVGWSPEAVVNTYQEWCEKEPETTGGRNVQEAFLRERLPGKEHENTAAEEEEKTGDDDEFKYSVRKQET